MTQNKVVNFNKMNPILRLFMKENQLRMTQTLLLDFISNPKSYNISYNYLFSAEDKDEKNEVLRIDLS